jgi:hypothetical protein
MVDMEHLTNLTRRALASPNILHMIELLKKEISKSEEPFIWKVLSEQLNGETFPKGILSAWIFVLKTRYLQSFSSTPKQCSIQCDHRGRREDENWRGREGNTDFRLTRKTTRMVCYPQECSTRCSYSRPPECRPFFSHKLLK